MSNFFNDWILTILLLLPLAGALIIWLLPAKSEGAIRVTALLFMVAGLVLGIVMWFAFKPVVGAEYATIFFFEKSVPWFSLGGYQINYAVGIDGIALLLVELTLLLGPVVVLSSWRAVTDRVKMYFMMMLLLQTGMLGALMAEDLFLFYVFWELMLIPMYFLIGIWGGQRRVYAAIKFFLFTMAGSVLMLLAVIFVGFSRDSFNIIVITQSVAKNPFPIMTQLPLFAAFALAFAIKVPMFPFHTWLPDAHVEAPTAGSVILAGVLLKMGTYGFVRFAMPFFPQATLYAAPLISILALVGIIYGALVSMVQMDVKKLVAYSSVSHLGFVMLGLFALNGAGVQGAVLQMINHGLSTGALFLLVGVIYERRHTRLITEFGGLSKVVPIYAIFFMVVTLSSIGLPGLNGFVGEFLILVGTFTSKNPGSTYFAVIAATGVIFAACYMLWMFQRVMFGPVTKAANKGLKDLNLREFVYLMIPLVFIVWIGVYPKPFLSKTEPAVNKFIEIVEKGRAVNTSQAAVDPVTVSALDPAPNQDKRIDQ